MSNMEKESLAYAEFQKLVSQAKFLHERGQNLADEYLPLRSKLTNLYDSIRYSMPLNNDSIKHFDADLKYQLTNIEKALTTLENEEDMKTLLEEVNKAQFLVTEREEAIRTMQSVEASVENRMQEAAAQAPQNPQSQPPVAPTPVQVQVVQPAPKKKSAVLPIVLTAVVLIGLFVAAYYIFLRPQKPNFKKVYADYCQSSWAEVASDGSYLNVDTNPSDIDDYYNQDAGDAIPKINIALGLPDSLYEKMIRTRAIDGRQSETYGNITVSWIYHPDHGLEILYERKGR